MHILLVGKAFSEIKQYLISNGHYYTLLQDRAATKYPQRHFKHRLVCDFSSEETILQAVDTINIQAPINGILTTYENYILSAARIARHLGLPGLNEQAALACTDKELMRSLFMQAPEKISPDFQVVTSRDDLVTFASSHSFPLILKPANLAKSLLVTKSHNLEELLHNYDHATELLATTYQKYAPNRTPKLIVEEFLEGPIFSVDAFVDKNGEPHVLENVVDYQTGYDIGFEDNFHYSRILPSRLPQSDIDAIRHVAAIGCRALGMTSSPAHVEIILTHDGPRIVEIGARNGGYRERMHRLANDIDLTKNALALSLNRPIDISPRKNNYVGVFELFPKNPGEFQGIANEDQLRSLPSLYYLSIKAEPGQYVGKAGDGYKACAIVILTHCNAEQFANDASFLHNHCQVDTSNSSVAK